MTHRIIVTTALLGLTAFAGSVAAQETGRVISSTPLIQQVAVPRQVCTSQPTAVSTPKSGAGAAVGAIAGGAMGNAVGQGGGKALATIVGVVGGAMLGNNIEGPNTQIQNVQQCTTQNFYENRTMGYNVVYEYGGKQYTVQMQNDPGPTVQLQVTPVGAMGGMPAPGNNPPAASGQPMSALQPDIYGAPPVMTSTTYVVPSYPAYPAYYGAGYYGGYYAPVGVSLGFGYRSGGYYRGGGHHHWR